MSMIDFILFGFLMVVAFGSVWLFLKFANEDNNK